MAFYFKLKQASKGELHSILVQLYYADNFGLRKVSSDG